MMPNDLMGYPPPYFEAKVLHLKGLFCKVFYLKELGPAVPLGLTLLIHSINSSRSARDFLQCIFLVFCVV